MFPSLNSEIHLVALCLVYMYMCMVRMAVGYSFRMRNWLRLFSTRVVSSPGCSFYWDHNYLLYWTGELSVKPSNCLCQHSQGHHWIDYNYRQPKAGWWGLTTVCLIIYIIFSSRCDSQQAVSVYRWWWEYNWCGLAPVVTSRIARWCFILLITHLWSSCLPVSVELTRTKQQFSCSMDSPQTQIISETFTSSTFDNGQ